MKAFLALLFVLIVALSIGFWWGLKSTRHASKNIPPFAPQLEAALKTNRTVFVSCVADWSIESQMDVPRIIETGSVQDVFKKDDVLRLTADWTDSDPGITKLLKQFGRSGVPTYVIYPGGAPTEPILLPQPLEKKDVLEGLNEARKKSSKEASKEPTPSPKP